MAPFSIITKELIEAHYERFADILLAAYSHSNYEVFKEAYDSDNYLDQSFAINVDIKKETKIIRCSEKLKYLSLLLE